MSKNENKEQHIQKELLEYIDIPYFKNNPSYIQMWRNLYKLKKDPQILLLMYYKRISTLFHWIYIELSNHFLSLNKPEIAFFILNEALKQDVYDKKVLQEEISKLPKFEKKYSKGDLAAILNQKNICALNRIWNKYEEKLFHEEHLPKDYVNFDMFKSIQYSQKHNELFVLKMNFDKYFATKIEDDGAVDFIIDFNDPKNQKFDLVSSIIDSGLCKNISGPLQSEVCKITIGNNEVSGCSKDNSMQDENMQNSQLCQTQKQNDESINSLDSSICQEKLSFIEIEGEMNLHSEIKIDGYVHIIQEINQLGYCTMKIAKGSDKTETVVAATYFIQELPFENINLLQNIKKIQILKNKNKLFVMFEYEKLESLSTVLKYCDSNTFLYYLHSVYSIYNEYISQGVFLINPTFFIDQNFKVLVGDYRLEKLSDVVNYSKQLKNILTELFGGFGIKFEHDIISNLNKLNQKISTNSFKMQFLKHKTSVLNQI